MPRWLALAKRGIFLWIEQSIRRSIKQQIHMFHHMDTSSTFFTSIYTLSLASTYIWVGSATLAISMVTLFSIRLKLLHPCLQQLC